MNEEVTAEWEPNQTFEPSVGEERWERVRRKMVPC